MSTVGVEALPVGVEAFRQAMARQVGAVHIVTTTGAHGDGGMTATAVSSVSDTPATLLVCLNCGSRLHDLVVASGVLAVNTLAAGQQELASLFAGQRGVPMEARFTHGRWERLASGAPVLDGALVSLDCRVVASHLIGTHRVFFCQVLAVADAPAPRRALVYGGRQYGEYGLPDLAGR